MNQSVILSALLVGMVLGTPACGSKFVSLGDEDAGTGGSNPFATGGANSLGVGGSSSAAMGGSGDCVCTDPAPMLPSELCSDGTIGGPQCGRHADGTCGWLIRTCPPENVGGASSGVGGAMAGVGGSFGCACGDPIPSVEHQVCSDGSVVTPYCQLYSNGTCNWVIRGCPVQGVGGASSGFGGAEAAGGAIDTLGGAMSAGGAIAAEGGSMGCACSGPMPKMANYNCPDGSIAGPVCDFDASGSCSWQIRVCPLESVGGSAAIGGAAAIGGSTGASVTCQYDGAIYGEGQSFPSTDGCNTCYCMAAGVACTKMACAPSVGGASSS